MEIALITNTGQCFSDNPDYRQRITSLLTFGIFDHIVLIGNDTDGTSLPNGIEHCSLWRRKTRRIVDADFLKMLRKLGKKRKTDKRIWIFGADAEGDVLRLALELSDCSLSSVVLANYCLSQSGEEYLGAALKCMEKIPGVKVISEDVASRFFLFESTDHRQDTRGARPATDEPKHKPKQNDEV